MLAAAAVLAFAAGAAQAANLVQNGSFEANGGVGQVGAVTLLTGWTVGAATDGTPIPFDFVLDANADSTGFNSSTGTIRVWGPNTPVGASSRGRGPQAPRSARHSRLLVLIGAPGSHPWR